MHLYLHAPSPVLCMPQPPAVQSPSQDPYVHWPDLSLLENNHLQHSGTETASSHFSMRPNSVGLQSERQQSEQYVAGSRITHFANELRHHDMAKTRCKHGKWTTHLGGFHAYAILNTPSNSNLVLRLSSSPCMSPAEACKSSSQSFASPFSIVWRPASTTK